MLIWTHPVAVRGSGRGNLNLHIEVRIPDRLTREERELYQRLRALEKSTRKNSDRFWPLCDSVRSSGGGSQDCGSDRLN
jgi:DnaJ-class molecular chaperone